nr:terminase gpA endonuclease subunit [Pseudaminobacter soli]
MESWLVDHVVLDGGPGDEACWAGLDALLSRTWQSASGKAMRILRLAIDTGFEAPAVYAWARRSGSSHVAPIKGVESFNRASSVTGPTYVDATSRGKRIRRGAKLWTVAGSAFKAETYRFLRLPRPSGEEREAGAAYPAGTIHLPTWIDSEWCKQFVGEQLVTVRTKRGFSRLEWQKLRERNEALDCRVYARAAAWLIGADRWPPSHWADLEAEFGFRAEPLVAAAPDADTDAGSPPPASSQPVRSVRYRRPQGRRVRRSSWMA